MDLLVKFSLLFTLISCAKTGYLLEQGMGQVSLEWDARSNDRVLMDPKVSEDHKEKIRLIEKVKSYFYEYFEMPETGIYDETTFLESDAVTHLVIVSPKDEIKAIKVSFPIMGSFPYLGFFKEKSALAYVREKQAQGFVTFKRKVYAYSTLNQWIFDDNILSSFFQLTKRQLVELIFHELVHTVLFVKNDVSFNENLAEVISSKLAQKYFEDDDIKIQARKDARGKSQKLLQLIVDKAKELNRLYKTSNDSEKTLIQFLEKDFLPSMKNACQSFGYKRCWPLKEKWNNARFAALGTYNSKRNRINNLFGKSGMDLKDFLYWILEKYDSYKGDKKFLNYLESEI